MKPSFVTRFIYTLFILAGLFFVAGAGLAVANAAPGEDYFTTGKTDTNSFVTWVGSQSSATVCDAFDAVFYDGTCVKENKSTGNNLLAGVGGVLSGNNNENEDTTEGGMTSVIPKVTLKETRCVEEDGVAEFKLESIALFKLVNVSTGQLKSSGATGADFQTFSDLPDGEYEFTGRNENGNIDKASFAIDCDPSGGVQSTLSVSCSVAPSAPDVGESVTWEGAAEGGTDPYRYDWDGAINSNNQFVTTSYSEPGEKVSYFTVKSGEDQKSARCSVEIQGDDKEDDGETESAMYRTIEEF